MNEFAALRIAARLSQAEVCELLGLRQEAVDSLEAGMVNPTPAQFQALRGVVAVRFAPSSGTSVDSYSRQSITRSASPIDSRTRSRTSPVDDQGDFFGSEAATEEEDSRRKKRAGAFVDNMRLPVHRWFRYSAGFSAEWVSSIVRESGARSLLDPFVGSGTTLLAAEQIGVHGVGFEAHPMIFRVARAKLGWPDDPNDFWSAAEAFCDRAMSRSLGTLERQSDLLSRCYSDKALVRLESLRLEFEETQFASAVIADLVWLCITSILRECSAVGTAQWQYVLPNRTKANVSDPYDAFRRKARTIHSDITTLRRTGVNPESRILNTDARQPNYQGEPFDIVVTSPPYPNNYDYADATRLEMTFWGEVETWSDLQSVVRQNLVRACSQHSAAERLRLEDLLCDSSVEAVRGELADVCGELDSVRQTKGGRKTYHTMVAAYFVDLARVWRSLRGLVRSGGRAHFVIGDSAPYGVYVPSDRWLGELALAAGFRSYRFEKLRDRNIKWKNRKHRVPLKEGILVVEA